MDRRKQGLPVKKLTTRLKAIKSVRKHSIFVGKAYGSPKGAKGYDRNKQKNWRNEI